MFKPANRNCASLKRFNVSNEKVEKVVNPPQKPTPRNSLKFGLINSRSPNPYINIPRRKLPRRFTIKVPNGKVIVKILKAAEEI